MALLTLIEVARRLGVSEKMARKLVQEFPGVNVGKRIRYPESAIHEFIARGGVRSQGNVPNAVDGRVSFA